MSTTGAGTVPVGSNDFCKGKDEYSSLNCLLLLPVGFIIPNSMLTLCLAGPVCSEAPLICISLSKILTITFGFSA